MSAYTTFSSPLSFDKTIHTITQRLYDMDMTIFAIINHHQVAEDCGLTLNPSTVILFGNPKIGTPLMQQAPLLALALPMRILIQQNGDTINLTMPNSKFLAESVDADPQLTAVLDKIPSLIKQWLND